MKCTKHACTKHHFHYITSRYEKQSQLKKLLIYIKMRRLEKAMNVRRKLNILETLAIRTNDHRLADEVIIAKDDLRKKGTL